MSVELQAAILDAISDLEQFATDTIWLTNFETVFERLTKLYLIAGGEEKTLKELYPHCY